MQLNDHLLYIDITNQCGLDCGFCMYEKERRESPQSLSLDHKSSKNLAGLINNEETSHIIISGEGEPFNNRKTIWDILALSDGNRDFQIITNGMWISSRLLEQLEMLNQLADKKRDKYSIRLSVDSYHANKIGLDTYLRFIETAARMNGNFPHIELAMRSIVEDKEYVRRLLRSIIERSKIDGEIVDDSIMDQRVVFASSTVNVNYKNLVNPDFYGRESIFPLVAYISELERKYGKPFTFGNLKTKRADKGLDITIKPDGKTYFYGIELKPHCDIFSDQVGIDRLKRIANEDPIISRAYQVPLMQVLLTLGENLEVKREIEAINNPYWLIKSLYFKHKEAFDKAFGIK